jgi:hypothetical protein
MLVGGRGTQGVEVDSPIQQGLIADPTGFDRTDDRRRRGEKSLPEILFSASEGPLSLAEGLFLSVRLIFDHSAGTSRSTPRQIRKPSRESE